MNFSLAVTSMRVELPSGKVPTTFVLLLISRLMRSTPSFYRIRRQRSGGNSVLASVSANPSRTVLAVDTGAPQGSSETSSILLVETPARYISTMASSTEVSRLR